MLLLLCWSSSAIWSSDNCPGVRYRRANIRPWSWLSTPEVAAAAPIPSTNPAVIASIMFRIYRTFRTPVSSPKKMVPARRRAVDERKDSPTTVYSDDWLPEQGGFETAMSREVLPKENGRKRLVIFRVELRWYPRENEFAVSFGTAADLSLQFRCRENAAGSKNSVRRTPVFSGRESPDQFPLLHRHQRVRTAREVSGPFSAPSIESLWTPPVVLTGWRSNGD